MVEELGLYNLKDFEDRAKLVMRGTMFNMVDGGFNDEITFTRTRKAFDSIAIRARYLVDVTDTDCSTTLLGQQISLPILPAPTGGQIGAHPEGDLATTGAAGAAGTIMILSHASAFTIEEVATTATGPVWCQIFPLRDRGYMREYIQRAEAVGCTAIVVTVDTPSLEMTKEQSLRNPNPPAQTQDVRGNLVRTEPDGTRTRINLRDEIDQDATWEYLDWIQSITKLPLVVKGILRSDDAKLSVQHGAKAIIVSNHGARLFDGMVTSIEALPEIVDAVDAHCDVLMDGGIRRAIDVLKALAIGAKAVCIGRPIMYGLAAGGQDGVRSVFEILRRELIFDMGMSGATNIADLNRRLLTRVPTLYEPGGFSSHWITG